MIVAHVANSLARITTTQAALLESDLEIIDAVSYKLLVERGTQMTRHKDVEAKDDHYLKID